MCAVPGNTLHIFNGQNVTDATLTFHTMIDFQSSREICTNIAVHTIVSWRNHAASSVIFSPGWILVELDSSGCHIEILYIMKRMIVNALGFMNPRPRCIPFISSPPRSSSSWRPYDDSRIERTSSVNEIYFLGIETWPIVQLVPSIFVSIVKAGANDIW